MLYQEKSVNPDLGTCAKVSNAAKPTVRKMASRINSIFANGLFFL
jgi:hypothetical protein